MAKHTILTDVDITAITKIYGLEINRFEPIDGGDANSSFLLNSLKSDYVLTVYEKKTLAEVDRMALTLKHLAEYQYYTNQVISTPDGRCVVEYHNKPIILKKWIPGDTLRDTDQKDYRSIGEAIAKLHQIPAPHLIPIEHPYGLVHMLKALGHGFDLEFETWLTDKINYLHDYFPRDLPKAFIHGDLFDDNLIYHKGQFQAIIDFEDACYYYKAYDLGSVLFGSCMENNQLDINKARDMIRGYREIGKLEESESSAIQFFVIYAGAAISAWHYINNNIRRPDEAKKDKHKQASKPTEQIFQIPQLEFNSILD